MKGERCAQVDHAIVHNVGCDIATAIKIVAIVGVAQVEQAAKSAVERKQVAAGIEVLFHIEKVPSQPSTTHHATCREPLAIATRALDIDNSTRLEAKPVAALRSPLPVVAQHGVESSIVIHPFTGRSILALGKMIILHIATQPASPSCPWIALAIKNHMKRLAMPQGLHLSPIEKKLAIAAAVPILHNGSPHIGVVIAHGIAPQVTWQSLGKQGAGHCAHCHLPALRRLKLVVECGQHLATLEIIVKGLKPCDPTLEQMGARGVALQAHAHFGAKPSENKRLVGAHVIAPLTVAEHRVEVNTPHHLLSTCHNAQNQQHQGQQKSRHNLHVDESN